MGRSDDEYDDDGIHLSLNSTGAVSLEHPRAILADTSDILARMLRGNCSRGISDLASIDVAELSCHILFVSARPTADCSDDQLNWHETSTYCITFLQLYTRDYCF